MNKPLFLLLMLIAGSAHATSDFFCTGEEFSAYIVVGSDSKIPDKDAVANVTIYKKNPRTEILYSYPEFISDEIKLINSEEDYSGNLLDIKLKNKDGSVSHLYANAKNGILEHMGKKYILSCEWER